jgi:hypothetical protein
MCGVSRQAIGKAVKAKNIKMIRGKVDLDHRLTCEYYHDKTGKSLKPDAKPVKKKAGKKTPPAPKPKPPEPTPPPVEPEPPLENQGNTPDDDPDPENGYSLPAGIKRFEDITIHNLHLIPQDLIKKIKEFEQGAKAKQDRLVKRGELIERKVVKQVFAKIHTVDTNQWKTLEDKIVPMLCGIFDAQDGGPESIRARKLISDEVTKILRYNKRLIDEFFDNQEVDG